MAANEVRLDLVGDGPRELPRPPDEVMREEKLLGQLASTGAQP